MRCSGLLTCVGEDASAGLKKNATDKASPFSVQSSANPKLKHPLTTRTMFNSKACTTFRGHPPTRRVRRCTFAAVRQINTVLRRRWVYTSGLVDD